MIKHNAIIAAAIAVVAIFIVSGFLGAGIFNGTSPVSGNSTTTTTSTSSQPQGTGAVSSGNSQPLLNLSISKNVNNYLFLPNQHPDITYSNGTVTPLYSFAPAPMGIGFFGLKNESGTLVGSNYYASSFEATIRINNLSVFNLANDGPRSLTFQLNTVTANTTLFGNSSYSFWTQNVATYSTRTGVLQFEDNIWNFSSPTAVMTANAIENSTGQVYPYPGVHIAIGPAYYVPAPFVLHLYLNTSEINGNNVVYFNYSIPTIAVSGTYDRVTFNSTYSVNHGRPGKYAAPPSYFRVSGTQFAPNNLLYDAEIMLGGPGGGSTTTVMGIDGTMGLKYIPATNPMERWPGRGPAMPPQAHPSPQQVSNVYVNVPSAFDFGTDTGETSVGMAVAWNEMDQAVLTAGPSLLYGMWNISGSYGMEQFTGSVAPSNAFLFVSPGTSVNNSYAGYVPLTASGSYDFYLPGGIYSAEALMSYHDPVSAILSGNQIFTLKYDPSTGIYTPLYAMNDQQLANISTSGTGTSYDPYVLFNSEYTFISPLFGELNDFAFPQFEGVMLLNTNDYVEMESMPAMPIVYSDTYMLYSEFFTQSADNFLGYWMYNDTHVILMNSSAITGWYTYEQGGFPVANVILWNTSDSLIAGNTFLSMDSSLLIYGGSGNLIWGNYFKNSPALLNPLQMSEWDVWGLVAGISVFSDNNTIVNNEFTVQLPALSPAYNIYTGNVSYYTNKWNLTLESSSATIYYTSAIALTGSIIGGPYLGGNFWYNFNGTIPYNDSGNIAVGGDYEPLNVIDLPPAHSVMLNGNTPYVITDPELDPYLLNLGPASPTTQMNITLYLNMTNLSELSIFDSSVNSPLSTDFHQFLTPQEFRTEFYPSDTEISSIMAYYAAEGFKVWNYSYAPLVVVLSGTAGMFEKAFGVMVYEYAFEYPGVSPTIFLTNTANPYIPAAFGSDIMHVYGLSYSTDVLLSASQKGATVAGENAVSSALPSNEILTPPNLENYYNVTQLHEMGLNGTGIKIGILGVGESVNVSSVRDFWDTYGIHNPSLTLVNLTANGLNPYPEGFEADLDVEWSGAMAPNASIYDVMAPFNLTGIGDNAINFELYYYLNVIHPQIISGSWAELQFHHDSGFAEIYDQIGMQAVAEGTTIFLGSADSHSSLYLTVMASQYIVSVGGVSVTMNSTGAITNETGWYQPEYTWYGGPVGSGGGNSYFYSRPVYQSAERIITPSAFYNRAQPDISMPSTNLITVFAGQYYTGGGTSYATPISAGIFADIAQYENQTMMPGNGYLGWIQPALYNLGYGTLYGYQAYHQVEYVEAYPGMIGSGYIGPGWNDFAGIGTISALNLTYDLSNYFMDSMYLSQGY